MLEQFGMAYQTLVLAICSSVSHLFHKKNKLCLIVLSIFTSSLTYSRITPAKQNHFFSFFFLSHLIGLKSLSNISEQGNKDFFLNSNKKWRIYQEYLKILMV